MKRKLAYILALCIATSVCISIVFAANIVDDTSSLDDVLSVVETELTVEDKTLQAEIAKYSDSTVDFRAKKQETIDGKNYDIFFEKFNAKDDPNKLVYKNEYGDSFEYDIETGKLCNMTLMSNVVKKTADSIDIKAAHKIALEYFPKDCNINEYTNDMLLESDNGYAIWYTRYIGK